MKHVVVVGSGVAGTAAALAASQRGVRVTLLNGGTGASVLAGGALDDGDWEDIETRATQSPLAEGARAVLDALAGYAVTENPALVAATTGLVRPARGVDRALLDLAPLGGATVLVPDCVHGGWDAAPLAQVWSASKRCKAATIRFVPVAAALLRYSEEHVFLDAELAACHDDPARLAWLGERLIEMRASFGEEVGGILLPRWLGVTGERATALSAQVGVPCGEALGGVGGPSGLRFEHARDRALTAANVATVLARAMRVRDMTRDGAEQPWRIDLDTRAGTATHIDADAVVLATGGLVGGGLEYTPTSAYFANALPTSPRPLLAVTCDAPVRLGESGRPLGDPSSLFGSSPETHVWPYVESPLLDRAGVLVREGGEVIGAPPGLYATGELAAGPSHTWLAALAHGARAGESASYFPAPGSTRPPRNI